MRFGHNSTIGKKLKPCKSCGKPCYWFSKQRCADCARVEDTMKRMEEESERVIEEEDLGTIISDLDVVFSQWIRLSAADKRGFLNCFICDKSVHWKEAHNMHYIKRGASLYLRFDHRNNKAGCEECNKWKDGNYIEYAKRLEDASPGITEILYEESVLAIKPTRSELKELIGFYSAQVIVIKNKLDD